MRREAPQRAYQALMPVGNSLVYLVETSHFPVGDVGQGVVSVRLRKVRFFPQNLNTTPTDEREAVRVSP